MSRTRALYRRTLEVLLPALILAAAVPVGAAQTPSTAPAFPRVFPAEAGFDAATLSRIRPEIQAIVDAGQVAGAVVVLARNGEIVYEDAIGRFDAGRPDPLRTDHLFRIYSMSKPVTAVAILKLQEQGRLNIDDPVSKYLPEFADVRVYAGGPAANPQLRAPSRPPTVADLMSHTAGLTYGVFGNTTVDSLYLQAGILDPSMTLAEFSEALAGVPLLYSPGDRWVYSVGLDLAGRVVEVASGMSFGEYLQRELFDPLGMDETSFFIRPGDESRLMPIHNPGPDGRVVPDRQIGPSFERTARFESGGGGLISTADDYLRFAQMLANGGELNGVRILSEESVEVLSRNHLPDAIRGTTLAGPTHGFGLAVAVQVAPPAGESGSAEGTYWWAGMASTNFWIDPENDIVGIYLTQRLPTGQDGGAYNTFHQIVYEALGR